MGATARYQFLESLRATIFGEILLCRDRQTQEKVVVKTIDITRALQQDSPLYGQVQENVLQEIEVMTRVAECGGHPNVIHMRHFFMARDGNMLHVVLDYCEGGDLLDACSPAKPERQHDGVKIEQDAAIECEGEAETVIEQDEQAAATTDPAACSAMPQIKSRLQEATALRYTRDVAAGLSFLHRHGIAHRDLSLENILLQDGRAVIADFGLCALQDPRDRASSSAGSTTFRCSEVVGKHYYMAPEVVSEVPYDPKKADIWSIGIVLFILLTASPPFEIAARMDPSFRYMELHGLRGILQAWGLTETISEATLSLLDAMTAIDPDHRPTIQQVLQHPALVQPRLVELSMAGLAVPS